VIASHPPVVRGAPAAGGEVRPYGLENDDLIFLNFLLRKQSSEKSLYYGLENDEWILL
jgi:hypothetical protein